MKISVVTAAWNAAATIGDTLASVQAQTGVECEHIIVDGGSTDSTLAIVDRFKRDGLKVISEPDQGIYDAMNKGMRLATGDMVGFLNADDYFCRSDALALIAKAAERAAKSDAVAGTVVIVDPARPERVLRTYNSLGYKRWMAKLGHMLPHPAFYVRRQAIELIGAFDTSYRIGADFDWILRFLFQANFDVETIGDTLVAMRQGGVSSQGLPSLSINNREIARSLKINGVNSNSPMAMARYFFKVLQMVRVARDYPAPASSRWPP